MGANFDLSPPPPPAKELWTLLSMVLTIPCRNRTCIAVTCSYKQGSPCLPKSLFISARSAITFGPSVRNSPSMPDTSIFCKSVEHLASQYQAFHRQHEVLVRRVVELMVQSMWISEPPPVYLQHFIPAYGSFIYPATFLMLVNVTYVDNITMGYRNYFMKIFHTLQCLHDALLRINIYRLGKVHHRNPSLGLMFTDIILGKRSAPDRKFVKHCYGSCKAVTLTH